MYNTLSKTRESEVSEKVSPDNGLGQSDTRTGNAVFTVLNKSHIDHKTITSRCDREGNSKVLNHSELPTGLSVTSNPSKHLKNISAKSQKIVKSNASLALQGNNGSDKLYPCFVLEDHGLVKKVPLIKSPEESTLMTRRQIIRLSDNLNQKQDLLHGLAKVSTKKIFITTVNGILYKIPKLDKIQDSTIFRRRNFSSLSAISML